MTNEYTGVRKRIYSKEDGPRADLWTEQERIDYRREIDAAVNEGMGATTYREERPHVELSAIELRERRLDRTNKERMVGRE